MSLSICTSCLARLRLEKAPSSIIPAASSILAASFHSSAINQNVVKKKTVKVAGVNAPRLRESRSARINKKSKERPKPPPVGQRRTERRRIVLSNTNAIPLQDHDKLTTENMSDSGRIGQVLALDGPLLDQLREAKAFKTTQNWNLFRTPSTLFRRQTAELGCDIEDVNEQKTTLQRLVVGEKMSGKSVHLLQAMSMAYLNEWMVINVPDCQEYVLNQSAYAPLRKKNEADEQTYVQPQLTSDLLTRFAYSNSNLLSKLTPIHNHSDLPKGRNVKTLHDLAMIGAQESSMATRIWDAVWKELTTKSQDGKTARPPILIAIDGINFWMGMTKYHSADYKPIHAHQFKLIKQLLTQVFNTTPNSLPNGGMVLACTTKSNHPSYPSFDLLVNQIRALNQGTQRQDPGFPLWDPYLKEADQRVYDLLNTAQNTQLVELKGLSKPESKGLLEYFALSGMLREAVTDNTVAEKWTLSGGGVVGEMCKLGARARTSMFETGPREGVRMRA